MSALIPVRRATRTARPARRLAERGLTTVEYAIGLLGAAAAALLLLRIFNDNSIFDAMMKWVTDIFVQAAAHD